MKCGIVGFNVPTRHIIGHFGDDFTGHMTQPTVSQHWRTAMKRGACIYSKILNLGES